MIALFSPKVHLALVVGAVTRAPTLAAPKYLPGGDGGGVSLRGTREVAAALGAHDKGG
jgi:hypothetical protein